jgi:hypothetical protein
MGAKRSLGYMDIHNAWQQRQKKVGILIMVAERS